jgi:hypothetical protein
MIDSIGKPTQFVKTNTPPTCYGKIELFIITVHKAAARL